MYEEIENGRHNSVVFQFILSVAHGNQQGSSSGEICMLPQFTS